MIFLVANMNCCNVFCARQLSRRKRCSCGGGGAGVSAGLLCKQARRRLHTVAQYHTRRIIWTPGPGPPQDHLTIVELTSAPSRLQSPHNTLFSHVLHTRHTHTPRTVILRRLLPYANSCCNCTARTNTTIFPAKVTKVFTIEAICVSL